MDFKEHALMSLWELVGGDELRPKEFTMSNAWQFYDEKSRQFPQATNCILRITPHGNRFEIVQLLVTDDMELIKLDDESCVGRRLLAESISEDVVDFLGGETFKLMQ